jgi:hypothetical protein
MNIKAIFGQRDLIYGKRHDLLVYGLLFVASACPMSAAAQAQTAPARTNPAQTTPAQPASAPASEINALVATLPASSTAEDRTRQAWTILSDAAGDLKHMQTRIQALAALGLLRNPRSSKMIADAMAEPDLDVRSAAILAAGENRDRTLTTNLRNMLDDKEPQVAFLAAMTLWKMGDRTGEDILMAVVDGERSAGPNMMRGTGHRIDKDLHNPSMLARLGALQGAAMLLGPFGFGITAFEFIHQSGGDLARVSAIEKLSQEKTPPIHKVLQAALADKDPAVRAASAKALVGYRDEATSMALYALFVDPKYPVRLTAAASYLRTTGVAGPPPARAIRGLFR